MIANISNVLFSLRSLKKLKLRKEILICGCLRSYPEKVEHVIAKAGGPSDVNQGCLLAIIGSEMWEIRDGAQILSACRLESICHYHEMSMEEKKEPVNTSKPKTQCRICQEKI